MMFISRRRAAGLSLPSPRFRPTLEALEDRRLLATFVVTNINDVGPGSFRQALEDNNNTPGQTNVIDFNIPGTGEHSFRPRSAFPTITNPVVIDGTTQPDYQGAPVIVLVGTYADVGEVSGLDIAAGNSTVKGLVINGFTGSGILLEQAGGNVIQNCYIGTDLTGTIAFFNNKGGVLTSLGSDHNLIGGTDPQDRNVISGNNGHGIDLFSSFNVVQGNYLGLMANGRFPLPNSKLGILIGNVFGETQGNIVGGTEPGAGNVISGNQEGGIEIDVLSHDNVVQGNLIGTDATGTAKRGNRQEGIVIKDGFNNLIGGTEPGAGNLISGNGGTALIIHTEGNLVEGNVIGLDITGTRAIPNAGNGVTITASNNTIGGTDPGAANIIAYNQGDGVYVAASSGNAIQQNAIYGQTGLGIDLAPDGNNDEPAPLLTDATTDGQNTTVAGTLTSLPDTTFTVEFFGNPDYDGTGNAQGEQFLGSMPVTTDDTGAAAFLMTLNGVADPGLYITATATDSDNNTSPFSPYVIVSLSTIVQIVPSSSIVVAPSGSGPAGRPTLDVQPTDQYRTAHSQPMPPLARPQVKADGVAWENDGWTIGQEFMPAF
jgi:hypothetical protein